MENKLNVDLIVVTYNSAALLGTLLRSIPESVNTIVVDNASSDASVTLATDLGAEVVKLQKNIGYGSACNVGASAGERPFLLFVNPDIRFETGAIEELLAAAAAYPDAVFNPYLIRGARRLFRHWSRLLPDSERWQGPPPEIDCEIPVLSGACIFIRREHFDHIGGFDPEIFLFHEDDDLSLRLRQAGIQPRMARHAIVDHAQGNSSARSVDTGRLKGEAMGRSLVYVMNKHERRLDASAELFRSYLKLLLPHVLFNAARRSKLRGFIRGLSSQSEENGLRRRNPIKEPSETVSERANRD